MNFEERQDRITDPLLAAAVAEVREELAVHVDWDAMRQSINERAALGLARRRSQRRYTVLRPLVPVAMAASVAFALWMGPGIYDRVFGPAPAPSLTADLTQDDLLVHALGGDLTEQEFRLLVTGRANPEMLLAVAIGSR